MQTICSDKYTSKRKGQKKRIADNLCHSVHIIRTMSAMCVVELGSLSCGRVESDNRSITEGLPKI